MKIDTLKVIVSYLLLTGNHWSTAHCCLLQSIQKKHESRCKAQTFLMVIINLYNKKSQDDICHDPLFYYHSIFIKRLYDSNAYIWIT